VTQTDRQTDILYNRTCATCVMFFFGLDQLHSPRLPTDDVTTHTHTHTHSNTKYCLVVNGFALVIAELWLCLNQGHRSWGLGVVTT